MGKLLLALLFFGLVGAACATTSTAVGREAPHGEMDGRALYEQSCQRCHALYMPASYYADEWKFFVKKYGRKARLNQEEQAKVYDYLARHAGT